MNTPDLIERLRREYCAPDKRPTIAELEAILAAPQAEPVTINPDGSVGTGYINPDGPEAADTIEQLQADKARLMEDLNALAQAEATYRYAHDILGTGDPKTGRAWDLMKRAGDKARATLTSLKKGESGR